MEGIVQNQKITSSVPLPGLVAEQFLTNDDHEIFAGKLKAEKDLWIAKGGFFSVINTTTGKLVASKIFTNNFFEVTCAAEYDSSIVFLGLKSESGAGCIGLFNVQAAKIEKTWELAHGVTSLTVLNAEANPLRTACGAHRILLAVGTQEGHVILLALNTLNQDQGDKEDEQEFDNDDTSILTYLSLRDLQKPQNWPTNADLALPLNDSAYHRSTFVYGHSQNDRAKLVPADVSVTSLRCVSATESLFVGFNFGGFQMWSLETLALMYVSPFSDDGLPPVVDFMFQEPDDDPRNFCYLWVIQSEAGVGSYASLYAFGFDRKFWDAEGKAYYEDLKSCNLRIEIDVAAVFTDMDLLDQGECRLVSCSSMQPPPLAESGESRSPVSSQALLVWEVKGESVSYYATLFDLNQWYHEHMPSIWKFEASTLCPFLGFFHIQLESYQRVIAAWPKNDSLAWFATKSPQEQFAYPSSLAYDLVVLVRSGIVTCKFVGLQLNLLNRLKSEGPTLLLQPSNTYCKAVKVGLIPEATDALTQKETREVLLTMALDNYRLSFLQDCVSQWADGSYLGSGCSLAFLEQWAWSSLVQAKQAWDKISPSLYDESNELDNLQQDELHTLSSKIGHLAAVLASIDRHAKKRFDYGNLHMESKVKAAGLLATFCKTVLWFVFAGLLPERAETACKDSFPFPAQELSEYYTKRRQDIERLSSNVRASEVLLIDVLAREGDPALALTWQEFGGKTGLYPPPSYEAILAGYLSGDVEMVTKHRLVQYLFLDLASLKAEERFLEQIEHLMTFPSTYSLPPSVIKLTQAFWLLDHQDFEEALTVLLDPLVLPSDVTLEQHKAVVKAFLYQGHPRLALKYATLRKLADPDAEQIRLHLTVLLACGLITDALQYRRRQAAQDKDGDLMQHFLEACHQLQKLHLVLQLPLHADEEDSLIAFLNQINSLTAKELLLMFYLQRSRFAEVNALHLSLNRGWPASDPLSKEKQLMRNTIVSGYLHVLPQLTSTLATLPTTQLTTAAQEKRPHPLSTTAKLSAGRPIFTSSGLICQALEKARATWTEKAAEPQTPFRKRKAAAPTLDAVPFLCGLLTPRAKDTRLAVNDELPTAKRQRLSYTSELLPRPQPESVTRLNEEVQTLLRTPPVVKRRTSMRAGAAAALSMSATPHSSILKGKPASITDEDQEGSIASHGAEAKHLRFALPRTNSEVSDIVNQSLASMGELERVAEVSAEEMEPAVTEEQSSVAKNQSMNQSGQEEFVSFEVSGSSAELNESQISAVPTESEEVMEEDWERTKESVEGEDAVEEEEEACEAFAKKFDESPTETPEEFAEESAMAEEELHEEYEEVEEEEGVEEEERSVETGGKTAAHDSDDEIVVLSSSEDDGQERSSEDKDDSREWEEEESEEEATTSEDSLSAAPAAREAVEAEVEDSRLRIEDSEAESEREEDEERLAVEEDEDTVENEFDVKEGSSILEDSVVVEEEAPKEDAVPEESEDALEDSKETEDSTDVYAGLEEENAPKDETEEENVALQVSEDVEEPMVFSQVTETVSRVEERVTSEGTVKITEEMRMQKFEEQRLVFSDSEEEKENGSSEEMQLDTSVEREESSTVPVCEDEAAWIPTPSQKEDTGISELQEETPSAMDESVVESVDKNTTEAGVLTQSSIEITGNETSDDTSATQQTTLPSADEKFEANRLRFEDSDDEEKEEQAEETGIASEDQPEQIVEPTESSLPVEKTEEETAESVDHPLEDQTDQVIEKAIPEAEPVSDLINADEAAQEVEVANSEPASPITEEHARQEQTAGDGSSMPVKEATVGLIQSMEESSPVEETQAKDKPLQLAPDAKSETMEANVSKAETVNEPETEINSSAMELTEIGIPAEPQVDNAPLAMDANETEVETEKFVSVAPPSPAAIMNVETQLDTETLPVQTESESQEPELEPKEPQPEVAVSEEKSSEVVESAPIGPTDVETSKTTRRRRGSRQSSQDSITRTTNVRKTRRRSTALEEDALNDTISMDVSMLETLVGADEEDKDEDAEVPQIVPRSVSRNSRTVTPEPHRMTRRSSLTPSRDTAPKLAEDTPDLEAEAVAMRLRRTPTRELRSLRQTTPLVEEREGEEEDAEAVHQRFRRTPTRELRNLQPVTPLLEAREEEDADAPKSSRKSKKTETRRTRESSESRDLAVPPSPLRRISRRIRSDSSPDSVASTSSEVLSTSHYALRSRPSTSAEPSPVKRRSRAASEASSGQASPVASTSRITRRRSVSKTVEVPQAETSEEKEPEVEVESKPEARGRRRSSSVQVSSPERSAAEPVPEDRPASRTRSRQGSLKDIRETEEANSDSDQSNASFTSTVSEPVRKRRRGKREADEYGEEREPGAEEESHSPPALKRQRAASEEPQQITRRSLRPRKSILAQPPALEPILEADSQLGSSVSNMSEGQRTDQEEGSASRSGRRAGGRRSSRSVFRQPKKRNIMRL